MTLAKLYGPTASRTGRVLWLARELGIAVEHIPLDIFAGETRTPEFLAINPMGQVPALEDDDEALAESFAITFYLAKKHGGPLAPATLIEEARTIQWSIWVLTAIEPTMISYVAHRTGLPAEYRDPAEVARTGEAIARPVAAFDAFLHAQGPYINGDRFTVADLNVASALAPVLASGLALDSLPSFSHWAELCFARPEAAGLLSPMVFPPPLVAKFLADHGSAMAR